MPRIPEQQLERLKQEISLQRLVEARGIELKKHGADLIGHCPFHDDKTPSLVISPKSNLWHCLGACQTGGSVIDWVMKAEGVSFRHAVEILRTEDGGQTTEPLSSPVKRSTVPKLPTPLASAGDDARLLAQVIEYYHQTLKQSPEALAYLDKRGVANAEAIDRFKLGYANRTLGYRLPAKNRAEGAAIRGQLQRLGLYRESGHEHFSGSLIIPVMSRCAGTQDVEQVIEVTEVYGRKINDHLRKGTPKHLYLPGPHRGVWNAHVLSSSPEIILCESLIDALTFWCAGFRNVTASYGVEGFTADHLKAFKTYGTERVLIAYDRDNAGDSAAAKLAQRLNAEGMDAYRLQFPHGMDANDYALQVTPANKSLGVVIRRAVWLGQGKAKPVTTARTIVPESPADAELIPPLAAKETTLVVSVVNTEATPEPVLPAAAVPPVPRSSVEAQSNARELTLQQGDRRYRIRGLDKNSGYDSLKINLLVARESPDGQGEIIHVDSFDLYQQRPRAAFIKQAALELGVAEDAIKADLGKVLLACEARQEQLQQATSSPKTEAVTLSDAEVQEALALLKDPHLLERIQHDFERCGMVGETSNALIGYCAALSRHLPRPLAVTIQSTSAAGKSALMEAILAFVPSEARLQYSALTGQSLYYLGERELRHKVLAIAEEEGASTAAYALKLLQSEGELTIASTGKDEQSGQLVTQAYRVEGPVMLLLTTTAIDVDEELLNRCLVLSVNESRQQTQAIHQRQRQQRTLQGLAARSERDAVIRLQQNAQRLLKPLAVVNPYAEQLGFVDDRTRARRDHDKYLTLIDTLALLHQHQRPIKTLSTAHGAPLQYVEVIPEDIQTANRLAAEALGRSLDELPPQTRRLLQLIQAWVNEQCTRLAVARNAYRFSRRELREHSHWSDTALKVHLARLVELEYLRVHRAGGQMYHYELCYQGEGAQGERFLLGLIDPSTLTLKTPTPYDYDADRSGQKPQRSGPSEWRSAPGQPPVRGQSASGQAVKTQDNDSTDNQLNESVQSAVKIAEFSAPHTPSYRSLSSAS